MGMSMQMKNFQHPLRYSEVIFDDICIRMEITKGLIREFDTTLMRFTPVLSPSTL